jgi:Tfp pilus assembly protein PilX
MNAMKTRTKFLGLHAQRGAALVIAIMILLILTVLGIYAVTTSTLETKIAGSERVLQEAFQAADGGVDYGRSVIELVLDNTSLPCTPHAGTKDGTTLFQEILGVPTSSWWDKDNSPWINPAIGKCGTQIHIDRIKAIQPEGQAAGFGEPVGETQATIYYRIDSVSSGIADARSQVQIIYRKKIHN